MPKESESQTPRKPYVTFSVSVERPLEAKLQRKLKATRPRTTRSGYVAALIAADVENEAKAAA